MDFLNIDRVHQASKHLYDFTIGTSNISSFQAARQILQFIDSSPQAM
jgi:hypothetical protein